MGYRILIAALFLVALFLSAACDPVPAPTPAVPAVEQAADGSQDLQARHGVLFKELRAMVKEMTETGRYDCCIESPCSHCALMVGGCSCGEGLRRGEPVCEECALMWMRGLGAESGIDPKTVRSFLEAERIINAEAARSGELQTMKGHKHKAKHKAKNKAKHKAH